MKVLSAEQIRDVDSLTTRRFHLPGLLLMENAALRTVEALQERFGPARAKRVLVVCGRGNNGGDGAAIARHLWLRKARVDVLLLGRLSDSTGDARINLDVISELAAHEASIHFSEIAAPGDLEAATAHLEYDLLVDALLGTGITRPASGLFEQAITLLNSLSVLTPLVSVDLPSGLASDSALLIGPAVRARLTVSFTAPKIANVLPPASTCGGELVVAAIGSPASLVESAGSHLTLIETAHVADWLGRSRRAAYSNKGDVGKILVVAGSRGKSGAACLAGDAALRSGAGLVTIATAKSVQQIVATQAPVECMTEALPETDSGSISVEAVAQIGALEAQRDVLAIGPGLGSPSVTGELVSRVVRSRQRPIVIDADGLNAMSPWPEDIRGEPSRPIVLTPHPGEMARLIGKPIEDVLLDRVRVARDFAMTHRVTLILKGSRCLIASPDGEVFVNPTGNSGMASGGTGDVLTGLVAGFFAQRPDDATAAGVAAVYLHGLAGDLAANCVGVRPMNASDILRFLGAALKEVGQDLELNGGHLKWRMRP